ncbi:MAG: hypothetical protein IH800_08070 [Myxococcales bacterium]|nr:hypothetical protein [Myxococcales bacterium]
MSRLGLCLLGLALLHSPGSALALEPVTVSVQGTVELNNENAGKARELALHAGLVEAALAVARRFVPPHVMEFQQERIREALETSAAGFVLTYRVDGPVGARPARADPAQQEFVLGLSATVDASRVRELLRTLGVLRQRGDRASVLLRVGLDPGGSEWAPSLPSSFAHYLTRHLEGEGLVVVDPALRAPGSAQPGSAFDHARSVGADVAIEVGVRWQRHASLGLMGGRAEVRVRALRTDDGSEVALARFEAPAYHADPDEAFARALEAVQAQVAQNLTLQLDRNWRALAAQESGPIELRLLNATSLGQVDAVQKTLRNVLGAEEASLITLAPWLAEIQVKGPLSPGALQDRLVRVVFDGFRLRPVEVSRQRVEVRVETLTDPDAGPGPPSVGGP